MGHVLRRIVTGRDKISFHWVSAPGNLTSSSSTRSIRLTRSLADFAKLVELFDISFVSVTQQFNTTTSMGRLTLNVLLSFAQFEREVTSERIRDKIAASKRKGLWVGGPPPRLSHEGRQDYRHRGRGRARPANLSALSRTRRRQCASTRPPGAEHPNQIKTARNGRDPGRCSLRPGFAILSAAQSLLCRRGQIEGRDPARGATRVMDRALFDAVQQKLTDQW